jgi:hypothetical protein
MVFIVAGFLYKMNVKLCECLWIVMSKLLMLLSFSFPTVNFSEHHILYY